MICIPDEEPSASKSLCLPLGDLFSSASLYVVVKLIPDWRRDQNAIGIFFLEAKVYYNRHPDQPTSYPGMNTIFREKATGTLN